MPQLGRISSATLERPESAEAPRGPWSISGALVQQVTFEASVEATLDALPDLLARPAPPYTRIRVIAHSDSPVGPYNEALLLVSCRYLMLPRHFVAASIVSTSEAQAANATNRGYTSVLGQVSLEEDGTGFVGHLSDDSGLSISINSKHATETGPAMIRYDPDVVVLPEDGEPTVFTVSADPSGVESAWIAVDTTVAYEGGARDSVWRRLRSLNPITATIARQDMDYPDPVAVKRPGA